MIPCAADPDKWFGYEEDGSNYRGTRARREAQQICVNECPALRWCARRALRAIEQLQNHPYQGHSPPPDKDGHSGGLDLDGVWAGVDLRGAVVHKNHVRQEVARQQLQDIVNDVCRGAA